VLPTTEPLFVSEGEATMFAGQPIGVIVANSRALAEKAALAVVITYTAALTAAILTLPSAIAAKSFQSTDFGSQTIESGDVNAALASAPKKVTATLSTFGMRHFTMEAQTALAYSDEGRHVVFTSSQNPDGARRAVARVLGVSGAAVSVKMRSAGGAYGSKLTRSLPIAAAVAVASDSIGAPVKMQCDMSTQMRLFGGRHPIQAEYTVGFTASGQILAVDLATYFDGGAYLDTSIDSVQEFQRAVDGVTFWPTFRAVATLCRTNSAPRTSCRAPGHMTASYVSETIVERVAQECGLDVNAVRLKNMYTARNCITPFGEFVDGYPRMLQVWAQLHTSADWDARVAAAKAFNAANKWRKRGISQQAVK
jgi:xanthine dehydrogenase molybdopterin-binding subunit B